MVGILCGSGKEINLARTMSKIIMPDMKDRLTSIVVFSMPNVNLTDKTVYGCLISRETITILKTELPLLIFNFAVQHKKTDIKKLSNLLEIENLTLLNLANSFNQCSVMEMLSSDPQTQRYIMPYTNITMEVFNPDFIEAGNFIIKPQNGSNRTKIIYGSNFGLEFNLYNWSGNQYSHLVDIQNAIFPTIRKGKWVLLKTPELMTYNNRLTTMRCYLQRNADGKWNVVLKTSISQNKRTHINSFMKIDDSLLQIMNCINCFISDLVFCSIDLIFGRDGTPYFLNLGGWKTLLPENKQNNILVKNLYQNMMTYAPILQNA
jgi:hypothetical protein